MVAFGFSFLIANILNILQLKNIILLGIALLCVAIPLLGKERILMPILIGLVCNVLAFSFYNYTTKEVEFNKQTLEFVAVATENEQRYDDYSSVFAKVTVLGQSFDTKIYFENSGKEIAVSDELFGTGYIYTPSYKDGFDSQSYYKGKGINVLISADQVTINYNDSMTFSKFFNQINLKVRENLDIMFGDDSSAFVKGLVLGDRSELDYKFSIDVNKMGIAHILAVSGMHIGFLFLMCLKVFKRGIGYSVSLVFITFFVLIIGFSPSVLRACIMQFILILGWFLGEEYSSENALMLALVILLTSNPYALYDVGFVLSFLSSGAIIFCMKPIFNAIKTNNAKVNKYLITPISIYLAVYFITFIPILYYFETISTLTALSNIVIIPIISILFPACITLVLVSFINIDIACFFAEYIEKVMEKLFFMIEKLANFEYSLVYFDIRHIFIVIVIGILLALSIKFKFFAKSTIIASFIVVTAVNIVFSYDYSNNTIINIFSVYDGQSILISSNGQNILIDCGSSGYKNAAEQINEYTYTNGIEQIDHLIITSVDNTHIRNINSLEIPINNVVFPDKNANNSAYEFLDEFLENSQAAQNGQLPEFIEINRDIDKKIAVKFEDFLILHAFTNNMIDQFIEIMPFTAENVVIADKVISDYRRLEAQFEALGVEFVYMSNDYDTLSTVSGLPAKTTIKNGDIKIIMEAIYG